MATALLSCTLVSVSTPSTALITSESLPTPDGSIKILSGAYVSITSFKDAPKSPTNEQQIQPEFISLISMPASFKNPPSIPISPNSFSIKTVFELFNTSLSNFLINVVFPAPKKPEKISIFVIFTASKKSFTECLFKIPPTAIILFFFLYHKLNVFYLSYIFLKKSKAITTLYQDLVIAFLFTIP